MTIPTRHLIWEHIRIPLIILVAVLLFLLVRTYNNRQVIIADHTIDRAQDTIIRLTDQFNQEHAQVNSLQRSLESIEDKYKTMLELKAAELKVSQDKISSVTTVGTRRLLNLDSLIEKNARHDTIYREGKIIPMVITKDVYIPVLDSLAITQYRKRINWLRTKPVVDVMSYQPLVTITSIRGFEIRPERNNINIGISLNYTATPQGMKVLPGIGLQYSFFGFHLGKR